MQVFEHNMQNDDTAYITVRLCALEHAELRAWMHTHPEQPFVSFPHGVRLEYRSMGWWRLNPSNNLRAASKLKTALAIVRKFSRSYQEKLKAEIQRLIVLQNPDLKLVAYTSENHIGTAAGTYHVQDARQPNKQATQPMAHVLPPDPAKLAKLQSHFRR